MCRQSFYLVLLCATLAVGAASGCATPRGDTIAAQRSHALAMRDEVLRDLESARPGIGQRLRSAAGYAVFSNVNVQVLLIGGGQGYGVAHDNTTSTNTYMKMAEFGIGIGAGAKDFRAVFLFRDAISLRRFVQEGWEFGGDADAALIAGGERGAQAGAAGRVGSGGASAGASATGSAGSEVSSVSESVGTGVEVYQITESGVALKAMIAGTKYWADPVLN